MVKCKDCKYKKNDDGKKYCHRYPPSPKITRPMATGYQCYWTEVDGNWECGEGMIEE